MALVCALFAFFVAPAAFASAPMCGENAESIAAPLLLLPSRNGEIKAIPDCDSALQLLRASPTPNRPHQLTTAEGNERALPLMGMLPRCPRGSLIERPDVDSSRAPAGYDPGVFRPPRG